MKKHSVTRLMCLLLVALMLLPVVACGKTEGNAAQTTTASATEATGENGENGDGTQSPAESTANTDANGYLKDDLNPSLNFGGDTFTLLYWGDREHEEFYVENQTGDLVNDAIYTRNQAVEERLGIEFAYVTKDGDAGAIANFTNAVNTSISAGDHSYDLIAAHSFTIGNCAAQGLLYNLTEVDHINFDQPWWPEKLISQATINDKLFFVSGDISANVIYMMYVTFFNKDMLEIFHLEDPYALVEEGKWTIDKQFEMGTGVYADLNGNGQKDIGDQYGQYTYTLHLDSFLWGSDVVFLDTTGEEPKVSPMRSWARRR